MIRWAKILLYIGIVVNIGTMGWNLVALFALNQPDASFGSDGWLDSWWPIYLIGSACLGIGVILYLFGSGKGNDR